MEHPAPDPLGADVAVTHILVVSDPARARDFWVNVLGAELYREYGQARHPAWASLGQERRRRTQGGRIAGSQMGSHQN